MLKRFLAITILISMIFHCAGRLGALDYIYEQRHAIALALGLVDEIPIAMCDSNYDHETGLVINTGGHSHAVPHSFLQAREINLYYISKIQFSSHPEILLARCVSSCVPDFYTLTLADSIFHPPTS